MFGDLLVRPDDRRPAALHEPATAAQLNGPHDVTYDAVGNLLIGGYRGARRIDARTGVIDTPFPREDTKVVVRERRRPPGDRDGQARPSCGPCRR